MAFAAVPVYLGDDFASSSPGMRFGMYLRVWGVDRKTGGRNWHTHDVDYQVRGQNQQARAIDSVNKREALDAACKLTPNDLELAQALAHRQKAGFDASGAADAGIRIEGECVAPFTTGLGNEHPLENGFAFLTPYGLPYLPGSGVKGVLRQAARELASGEWGTDSGWTQDARHQLGEGPSRLTFSDVDALFGRESADLDTGHLRGCLTFWDVIPQLRGDALMVDIMTPHQTGYYQAGESPHDSGAPTPLTFLTVPPGSAMVFHVQCDSLRLLDLAPDLAHQQRWQGLLQAAFDHAFTWLGFGAKTAVGYGAMQIDEAARKRKAAHLAAMAADAEQRAAQAAHEEKRRNLGPAELHIDDLWAQRPDKTWNMLTTLFKALEGGKVDAPHRVAVARHVQSLMENSKKWAPTTAKKNPAKDNNHQDTLKVQSWLKGA